MNFFQSFFQNALSGVSNLVVYVAIVVLFVVGLVRCIAPVVHTRGTLRRAIRSIRSQGDKKYAWQQDDFLGKGALYPHWSEYLNNLFFADGVYHNASNVEDYINEETVMYGPGRASFAESLPGLMTSLGLMAQEGNKKRQEVDYDSPTFVPMVKVGKVLENGDSIQYMEMNNVYVYPPIAFSSKKQQMAYNRLVKNVKIVLPIAKEARKIMMETAEYLETLPDKNAKEAHMKLVERSIMKEYKPRMKKLTFSQGKLLIKLIYRESNSSGYELIQAFLGPVRAGFYQAFAWAFGASLKKRYDPEGVDRLTERVVLMVEAGQI